MTRAPIIDVLETRYPGVRVQPNGWTIAGCPAHEDRRASFGWIVHEHGKVGLKCQAGCRNEDIVAALGARMADLFPPTERPSEVVSTTEYEVRDGDGNVVAVHVRRDLADGTKQVFWKGGLNGRGVASLPLYGAHRASEWRDGASVLVVEGERACEALWAAGVAAVATYGAEHRPEPGPLEVLRGRVVTLWPDADEPGRRHMLDLDRRLEGIAAEVRWLRPPDDAPKGWDAADCLALADDPMAALKALKDRIGAVPAPSGSFPEPEDYARAALSDMGTVEYVVDLIRPGRIHLVVAEEGTGKSFAMHELGVRFAVAGGSWAGAWEVTGSGPVLVCFEMHPDDDLAYVLEVCRSLDVTQDQLAGRYHRLGLLTAANGRPALMEPEWRASVGAWVRRVGARLLIVDTATTATQIEPWGRDLLGLISELRALLAAEPELALVLVLHFRKPQSRGKRQITDVIGEWGRWADILILLERAEARTVVTTRKRVRHERRISALRAGGLLTEPIDLTDAKPEKRVKTSDQLATIEARPGLTYAELAEVWGVSKETVRKWVGDLGTRVVTVPGARNQVRVYASGAETALGGDRQPPSDRQASTVGGGIGGGLAVTANRQGDPYREEGSLGLVVADTASDLTPDAEEAFGDMLEGA